MNLLLLSEKELTGPNQACVRNPRQLEHLTRILKLTEGDTLTVGLLSGKMGQGTVTAIAPGEVHLKLALHQAPPSPLPLTLILALPRPQQIKRILQTIGGTGIKEVHLLHTRRVEKSYWQSPSVEDAAVQEQLWLGLEQGKDTLMPNIHRHKRFRPFAEDTLPELMKGSLPLMAHPYTETPCPSGIQQKVTLAVGPEGGFNDYETEQLMGLGFQAVHLGPRILKTETALPYLLGRLF